MSRLPESASLLDTHGLAQETARQVLSEAIGDADDGEIFLERSRSESFLFDDGRLKSAAFDTSDGFGLRVVAGESAGYAHSSEVSEAALKRAAGSAALARRGYSGKTDAGPRPTNQRLYEDIDPTDSPDFESKVALLQEIDAWCRARDPRVVQVMASLAGEQRTVEILRADGRLIRDVRPLARINVQITVEHDGRRETGYAGAGGRAGFEAWIAPDRWRAQAEEALRQALVNLEAGPCPAGEMDVVLGAGWNGVLLHEGLMGLKTTGNGRRQSYAHIPMPRMTNTAMEGGSTPREEMIASTRRGLYCANFGGGQVDITNGKFVFQCTEAYLIEDGRITRPVKGATLIGDGPTALTRVTMIGDDFDFDPGVGVCGKSGQSVPVGVGQPSLKITGLTVGGAGG